MIAMDEGELELFREAGKIGSRIREKSKSLVTVGRPLLEIVETIEQMMADEGAKPAFPTTICLDEIAAHYTPETDSSSLLEEKNLVKVDLGVCLDGGLSDTAYTIDLSGKYEKIVKASEESLGKAIEAIAPDVLAGDVGGEIERTIQSYGLKPIANLSGHKIERNLLHAGFNIPNIQTYESYLFEEGDIFAVETFATDGAGYVGALEKSGIFSVENPSTIRSRRSKKIVDFIKNNYGTLPFTDRWIRKEFDSRLLVSMAIKELLESESLVSHPPLRDADGGMVAQFEHTVLVTDSGCEVLTI